MKKLLRYIILLLIVTLSLFFIFQTRDRIQQKEATKEHIQQMPSLQLQNVAGGIVNIQEIAGQYPAVIIYFSSDCNHCQYEAAELKKNIQQFRNVQILMITRSSATETRQFAKDYGLDHTTNVHFLLDKTDAFYKTFGTHRFPSIFIYNREHQLIKKYIGETKIPAIVQDINM